MNGHSILNISDNWLLHIATHLFTKSVSCRSAKFTTGDFECMVRLKKFILQKFIYLEQIDLYWIQFVYGLYFQGLKNKEKKS